MNFEVWGEVNKRIQNPDEACNFIIKLMKDCEDKTFNSLITLDFTNSLVQIQNSISAFYSKCNKLFNVKAIYLEMNGFDINPNRWFFDFFGYDNLHQDGDSLDWLADWQSPDYPSVTLTGLESIQNLYSNYMSKKLYRDDNKKFDEELATLLVMAKFCKLIAESTNDINLGIDIYTTAHDFDIIYHRKA
jgi:hypothetical protein